MGIDIFLSSASRSGYSQDIVDIFAKPNRAIHKHRYASKWIGAEVQKRSEEGSYNNIQPAILCFVDQVTQNVQPRIMPIRYATIVSVRGHGTTRSIVFRLGDFCRFSDLKTLNDDLRAACPDLPEYKHGKIVGKYWVYKESDWETELIPTKSLSDWELLIDEYYELPNPNQNLPFYRFQGFLDIKTDNIVEPWSNDQELIYKLVGGREYDIQVYQFHPKRDFPDVTLQITSDHDVLMPLNGDSRVFDTRYDQKDYRFKAKQIMLGADSLLSFRRNETQTGKLIWEDFVLRIEIKPSLWKTLAYALASGVAFAVPFAARAASDWDKEWPTVLAASVGGFLVGLVTLFKDKIRV